MLGTDERPFVPMEVLGRADGDGLGMVHWCVALLCPQGTTGTGRKRTPPHGWDRCVWRTCACAVAATALLLSHLLLSPAPNLQVRCGWRRHGRVTLVRGVSALKSVAQLIFWTAFPCTFALAHSPMLQHCKPMPSNS